ncbi:hypothetical protein HBI56_197430 [Parastagonospora nodorum]|uniref:Uncharacterized protein n=1 Tax=Phaeosphaeria nodorum (strain SN15 / ATCC MYA-4574 / FGSC 10173) TaxID=321614 RepID=A0A7U2I1C9_PHANO|nr:hypothetical protein HBH56_209390 [Parastagonospora nodorum]QRC99690.1 hypothetical protein JI435_413810 [Parastagonospora nodorum SN15]KAH3923586.1 hypothetical protein HBH54_208260 [Parastagonospora nodorum]KAH3941659.1 hypothetical protein HBH53_198560 [Parastagonospora nodorum]KAH3960434.1 hypothetical protein HBH51_192770 [Parastagonospora nodorum]
MPQYCVERHIIEIWISMAFSLVRPVASAESKLKTKFLRKRRCHELETRCL